MPPTDETHPGYGLSRLSGGAPNCMKPSTRLATGSTTHRINSRRWVIVFTPSAAMNNAIAGSSDNALRKVAPDVNDQVVANDGTPAAVRSWPSVSRAGARCHTPSDNGSSWAQGNKAIADSATSPSNRTREPGNSPKIGRAHV